MVSACILIRTRHGEYGKVVERLETLEGVTRVFPVLGRYDVVVDFKAPDMARLGKSVLKISRMAGVVFTETLIGIEEGEERC